MLLLPWLLLSFPQGTCFIDAALATAYPKHMQVSAEYAQSHLEELLAATEIGEEIQIARPDKPTIKLTLAPSPLPFDRTGMIGSGKGKIWYADDWDSPETNEEIARLFNEGPIFPDES